MRSLLLLLFAITFAHNAISATLTGNLESGGGVDDLHIVIRTAEGKKFSAFCAARCGDWFEEDSSTGIRRLLKSLKGKPVTLTYAFEPNRSRIAGAGDRETLAFVKKIKFQP
jgi:hypothetical protein